MTAMKIINTLKLILIDHRFAKYRFFIEAWRSGFHCLFSKKPKEESEQVENMGIDDCENSD